MRETLPRHSIRVVAERTGLTPDVLRVWERRYDAVTPARGSGGQRVYSDEEVERLRLLQRATIAGRSIGSIAGMSTEELEEMVREDDEARPPLARAPVQLSYDGDMEVAMAFVRSLDAGGLEVFLRRRLAGLGVTGFLEGVVVPLLQRVGDEWHIGRVTIAQEHLTSSLVKQLLNGIIGNPMHSPGARSVLVATPAGDEHELGSLLAAATATAEGWRVVNLGPDLPAREIATAATQMKADLVALSVTYAPDALETLQELRDLRAQLPDEIPLLLGGAAAIRMKDRIRLERVTVVATFAELRAELNKKL
jgi:MerR family transcriptional regulator, light-induced transcriptional regulator